MSRSRDALPLQRGSEAPRLQAADPQASRTVEALPSSGHQAHGGRFPLPAPGLLGGGLEFSPRGQVRALPGPLISPRPALCLAQTCTTYKFAATRPASRAPAALLSHRWGCAQLVPSSRLSSVVSRRWGGGREEERRCRHQMWSQGERSDPPKVTGRRGVPERESESSQTGRLQTSSIRVTIVATIYYRAHSPVHWLLFSPEQLRRLTAPASLPISRPWMDASLCLG